MNSCIRNWSEYNLSLKSRGSISVWISSCKPEKWIHRRKKGVNGRPRKYSDEAILVCLMIREIFKLPLRQSQSLLASLFEILKLELEVPNYTLVSRRAAALSKVIERLFKKSGSCDLVIDSTGIKLYGEGEWLRKQHGVQKRRGWKKLHLAVCPNTHTIRAVRITDNKRHDSQEVEDLLAQVQGKIRTVYADGAYDSMSVRKALALRGVIAKIPIPKNATLTEGKWPWQQARDEQVRAIQRLGGDEEARRIYKKLTGYHKRSLAETAMSRMKSTFGGSLKNRKDENQATELLLRCHLLNLFTDLGMPKRKAA